MGIIRAYLYGCMLVILILFLKTFNNLQKLKDKNIAIIHQAVVDAVFGGLLISTKQHLEQINTALQMA